MERLTTEQIADMKEYFSRSKEVKTSSLAMKLSHDGLKLIDTIEAQQQEIEQLENQNDALSATVNMFAPYIIGKKESEVVEELKELLTLKKQNEALLADKDEQAGRIMQYDAVLKQARKALKTCEEIASSEKNQLFWTADVAQKSIKAIDALLGGGEDGSSKDE